MLSLKHGVTAHRRLLAVVWYNRRCKTFFYKSLRMAFYGIQAFLDVYKRQGWRRGSRNSRWIGFGKIRHGIFNNGCLLYTSLRHKNFYSYETAKPFKMIYFWYKKMHTSDKFGLIWGVMQKDVILKQYWLISTQPKPVSYTHLWGRIRRRTKGICRKTRRNWKTLQRRLRLSLIHIWWKCLAG